MADATPTESAQAQIDADKVAIKLVQTEFDRYAKMRQPFEVKWRIQDQLYHMLEDRRKAVNGRANLTVVDAFEAVETIVPRIVGNRAKFTLAARRADWSRNAQIQTELCDYQQDLMGSEMVAQDVYRDCAKHGTGLSWMGWRQEIKELEYDATVEQPKETEPGKVEGEFKRKEVKEEVVYDDPKEEWLSLWQVYLDPYVQDVDCQHSVIIVSVKRKSWAEAKIEATIFRGDPAQLTAGGPKSADETKYLRESLLAQGLQLDFEDDVNDPFGIVFERWTGDRVITTWNNKLVLRDRPSPFKHGKVSLLATVYTRVAGQFYGKGAIEAAEPQIQELTDHRNIILDDANARAHSMWKRRRGAKIDDDQLISRPDGIVDVSSLNGDIERLDRGPADPMALQMVSQLREDIRRATGQGSYALGELPTKRVTNGEVATAAESSASRMDMPLATFESMYVKRKGFMLYKMNQQFVTDEKTYRVTGKVSFTKTISCNELQGEFDVIPVSGSSKAVNRAIKRREMLQFLQISQGQRWFNAPKFAQDLLEQTFDLPNAEEYIIAEARPKEGENEAKLMAMSENLTFLRTGFIGDAMAHQDHPVHNLIHEAVYKSPQFKSLPPEVQQRFSLHVLQHDDFAKQEAPAPQPSNGLTLLPAEGGPGAVSEAPPELSPNPSGI